MADNLADYMTTTQAAAYLGISEGMLRIIYDANPGKFRRVKVGRSVMWHREDVEALKRERESEGK